MTNSTIKQVADRFLEEGIMYALNPIALGFILEELMQRGVYFYLSGTQSGSWDRTVYKLEIRLASSNRKWGWDYGKDERLKIALGKSAGQALNLEDVFCFNAKCINSLKNIAEQP